MCKIICSTTLVTHKSNNLLQNFRVAIDVYTKTHKSLYQKNLDEINRYNKLNCRYEIRRKFRFRRGSFPISGDTFIKKIAKFSKIKNFKNKIQNDL